MSRFVSIDLGNHRIVAYEYENEKVHVLKDPYGKRFSNQIISFISGVRFWGNMVTFSPNSTSITNEIECIGSKIGDIEKLASENPVIVQDDKLMYSIEWDGKSHLVSPVTLLAYIIDSICGWTKHKIHKIVIVAPPYWTMENYSAVKLAGLVYGRKVYIISSRMAHVIDYVVRAPRQQKQVVALCDFGHTHFDLTVYSVDFMKIHKEMSFIARGAGEEITDALFTYIIRKIKNEINDKDARESIKAIEENPTSRDARLFRNAIDGLKKDLSFCDNVVFNPVEISDGDIVKIEVGREELENLDACQEIGKNITNGIKGVLKQFPVSADNAISAVSLQGGSGQIPLFRNIVADAFSIPVENLCSFLNPEECFAEGAIYYRMRKKKFTKSHKIIVDNEEIENIKRQESELNESTFQHIDIEEVKKGIQKFHTNLTALKDHKRFKHIHGENCDKILELHAVVSDYVETKLEDLTDSKTGLLSLQEWNARYHSITGQERIVLPRK